MIRSTTPWALLFMLALAGSTMALPRFSAQYAQSCHLCHVNPAGGGLRTEYGSQFFAGTELAAKGMPQEQLTWLSTKLSERVDLGLDFRMMSLFESQSEDPRTSLGTHERSTFFLMQGDIGLGLRISDDVQVVLEKSLRGEGEAYALLSVLPWHGSIKAGRFLPFHGWRWVDHDTAARRALGFGPGEIDTGVEVELHPDHFSLSTALTNDGSFTLDGNQGKALTLRAVWQGAALGGSASFGVNGRVTDRSPAPSRSLAGLLAGYSLGRFTWTAQLDQFTQDEISGVALSQEVAWHLRPGLDVLFVHDFFDTDLDLQSGMDLRQRIALDWIPRPGVSLQPGLSLLRHEESNEKDEWLQAEIQLYLFM